MRDALTAVLVKDMPRALLLAAAAFVLTLATGGFWVRFLRENGIGHSFERINDPRERGLEG